MKIKVNGIEKKISGKITVKQFLLDLRINPEVVIVEKNKKIINKKNYSKEFIRDKDVLEIVRFMVGG